MKLTTLSKWIGMTERGESGRNGNNDDSVLNGNFEFDKFACEFFIVNTSNNVEVLKWYEQWLMDQW